MKFAACDLGSNSLKLTAVEVTSSGMQVIYEDAVVTRIGEGLDRSGQLGELPMSRTLEALATRVATVRALGVERVRCVATAGMRGASNANTFIQRVLERTGVEIELIDGLREAELAFMSPAADFGPGPVLVVDPGGRSTELVLGTLGHIEARVSLEMGSVRLTERFHKSDPPRTEELEASAAFVREQLEVNAPATNPKSVMVGVSGTIMALLGLQLGIDSIQELVDTHEGSPLFEESVSRSYETLLRQTARERLRGTIIPEGRADVIVAGAQLVLEIMRHYGRDRLYATQRGVRYGLLAEMRASLALAGSPALD